MIKEMQTFLHQAMDVAKSMFNFFGPTKHSAPPQLQVLSTVYNRAVPHIYTLYDAFIEINSKTPKQYSNI
jgi:hypothetical protein